jgi:oxalyl-CoA decarboxylase
MSSVRTDKEASTTLDDALKPKNRAADGDAVVLALKQPTEESASAQDATIDGFHLVIDALKLNDIDTIFGLPGIPITD